MVLSRLNYVFIRLFAVVGVSSSNSTSGMGVTDGCNIKRESVAPKCLYPSLACGWTLYSIEDLRIDPFVVFADKYHRSDDWVVL